MVNASRGVDAKGRVLARSPDYFEVRRAGIARVGLGEGIWHWRCVDVCGVHSMAAGMRVEREG